MRDFVQDAERPFVYAEYFRSFWQYEFNSIRKVFLESDVETKNGTVFRFCSEILMKVVESMNQDIRFSTSSRSVNDDYGIHRLTHEGILFFRKFESYVSESGSSNARLFYGFRFGQSRFLFDGSSLFNTNVYERSSSVRLRRNHDGILDDDFMLFVGCLKL